jgi:two-component system sensor histidine kinase KdpD
VTSRILRSTLRWTAAAILLAAIVLAYTRFLQVNPTTVALTLLLSILLLAAWWGMRYAVVASLASALSPSSPFSPPR